MNIKKEDINMVNDQTSTNSDNKKELLILRENFKMLLQTLHEASVKSDQQTVDLIKTSINETISRTKTINEDEAALMENELKCLDRDAFIVNKPRTQVLNFVDDEKINMPNKDSNGEDGETPQIKRDAQLNQDDFVIPNVQYDIIPLPSKGQCYKHKKSRIPVSYLTAYDENMITSPNLYRDGLITDLLLKNKVLDKNIDLNDLCVGDVDAIMLFLRVTSYGADFPIEVNDPETGNKIETNIDLSDLKIKEFVLEGDENGFFDYQLPMSKDLVKFKFLTRQDEKTLLKLNKLEDNGVKAEEIRSSIDTIERIIKQEETITSKTKQTIIDNLHQIDPLIDKMQLRNNSMYAKNVTNKLIMSIVSINGNNNKEFISDYVMRMPAKDSLMLRRYIVENEPGIDFEITINRPESLGGGSFKTFLKWDDFIFLNIA